MPERDSYELSAAYMNGLVNAVRSGGFLDGALITMTEIERSSYQQPARQPWWDARYAEHLAAVVGQVFGEWALEQVGYTVVAEVMGPLVKPQIEAALATGAGPEALFARLDELAKPAVRPLRITWTATSVSSGKLELTYPRQLEKETQVLWRGAIRYAFELTRRTGKIVKEGQAPAGHLAYELEWT
jgi:hypothetical protein